MIPTNSRHSKEFYQAACWISGFYIFKEMRGHRIDKSGYYGLPQRVDFDGINKVCVFVVCEVNGLPIIGGEGGQLPHF